MKENQIGVPYSENWEAANQKHLLTLVYTKKNMDGVATSSPAAHQKNIIIRAFVNITEFGAYFSPNSKMMIQNTENSTICSNETFQKSFDRGWPDRSSGQEWCTSRYICLLRSKRSGAYRTFDAHSEICV